MTCNTLQKNNRPPQTMQLNDMLRRSHGAVTLKVAAVTVVLSGAAESGVIRTKGKFCDHRGTKGELSG